MANQSEEGLLSPFLRKQRLAAAEPFLRGRVLDIGCGVGELANHIPAARYFGIDIDESSLLEARRRHPGHCFTTDFPSGETFDTVVALAVVEHLADPARELQLWSTFVANGGHIILTTPHPIGDQIHKLGARAGLFSFSAAEEHTTLLDRAMIASIAHRIGMTIAVFKRFLVGFNQLAVLEKN